MNKKTILVMLLGILVIGGALRFYKLGNNSFVADEFLDINATYGYFKTGVWQAWDFNLEEVNKANINPARDERSWMYRWEVAQLFRFLPPTEAVARSVSVLWGLMTIVLMYFVGKYYGGKKEVGLLSAFLFAVSISGIIFDRRFRMYAAFFPLYLLFSWLIFLFLEKRYAGKEKLTSYFQEKTGFNIWFILPMLLVGFLSLQMHLLTVTMIVVVLAYAIFNFISEGFSQKRWLNKYLWIILAYVFAYGAGVLFFPERLQGLTGIAKFFNVQLSYIGKILVDYSHPVLAVGFLLLGVYYLYVQKENRKKAVWLVISFLVPLLMALFIWPTVSGSQYIFFIQSFEMLLIAAGIYFLADFLRNNITCFGARTFFVVIALVLFILPNFAYFFAENNAYRQTSESENPNFRKIFTHIKKNMNKEDVFITRNFRNYYWDKQKVKVFDFGGELAEKKLSLEEVQEIISANKSGWIILSENDEVYVSKEALVYMEKNLTRINDIQVRGQVKVYRW